MTFPVRYDTISPCPVPAAGHIGRKTREGNAAMSLDKLAPKIARRDARAFEELYERMRRLVYSVCLGVVRDSAAAEELAQDTFVTVWEQAPDFRGEGFKTWILTIAKNKALNALRKTKREFPADFTENETLGGCYTIDSAAETGIALSAALSLLSETDREIVLLRNSGMKAKELAEFLGLPRGTVSWRYSEALKLMKKYLEEDSR